MMVRDVDEQCECYWRTSRSCVPLAGGSCCRRDAAALQSPWGTALDLLGELVLKGKWVHLTQVVLVDGLFLVVKAGVRMWRNMKLWLVFCSSLKWDLSSRLTSLWKVKAPFKPRRCPRTVPWQIPLYVVWFVLCHTLCWGHRQCLGFLKARHRNVMGGDTPS